MPTTNPCPTCATPVPVQSRYCQGCGAAVALAGKPARASSQWLILVAGALVILVVVGAAIVWIGTGKPAQPAAVAPGTQIAGAGPLPNWLTTAESSVVAEYAWAAEHYEELRYMPCYCGCNSVGHTDNASCYFRWDENGKIEGYDSHALG